jgi:putative nucleotidyltransferase with HDIG domain
MENGEQGSESYSEVILSKVDPEKPLPTDIYLKVDKKFIKFKSKGDPIGTEKFELFISKGVKNVFILSDEIMDFLAWLNDSKEIDEDTFVRGAGEQSRGFFQRSQDFKEKIYEVFFEDDLNETIVEALQDNVSDFVENIKENPITAQAISLMLNKNQGVADHSVNVANLSVYLGMALGHGHQFVLENLYMGAIFHDYGKLKIDPKILENNNNRLYSQAVQDHPITGVKMLRKTQGIPAQVFSIIEQHHEQFNGHGFPNGRAGDDIYDLAQIVSIANVFDNTLTENKQLPVRERNKRAIKVIEIDKGKQWNPKYIPRVLEALTIAFSIKKESA